MKEKVERGGRREIGTKERKRKEGRVLVKRRRKGRVMKKKKLLLE